MNSNIYAQRRERLRKLMHKKGLDALLISYAANRFYLSGFELHDVQFNESAGYILLTSSGKDWLCTDSRYLDAAKKLWDENYIVIYGGNNAEQLRKFIKENCNGSIGIEENGLSLDFYRKLSLGLSLRPAQGLVESLRIIKDAHEIDLMKKSCAINYRLMEWVYDQLHIGRSEADLSWAIEVFFRENGASELAFSNIVAVGKNAALPHYNPGKDCIRDNSSILIDVGARVDNYCSDQTRSFWIGDNPSVEFMLTQQLVRVAQETAMQAIRPGLKCSDIYKVAYDVFVNEGVEKHFTHGLGHGVGLETHEAPSLSPRCHTVLEPGMIVTVEPGLYYPEWGGVRKEFMMLIEEDGASRL